MQTQSGKVYTGLLVKKDQGRISLRDSKNELLQIPQNEIESMVVQKKSIMPEQLFRDLTAEQAAHLLAYLESLK